MLFRFFISKYFPLNPCSNISAQMLTVHLALWWCISSNQLPAVNHLLHHTYSGNVNLNLKRWCWPQNHHWLQLSYNVTIMAAVNSISCIYSLYTHACGTAKSWKSFWLESWNSGMKVDDFNPKIILTGSDPWPWTRCQWLVEMKL